MRLLIVVTLSFALPILVGCGGSGTSAPPRAKTERNPAVAIEQAPPLLQTEPGATFRFVSPSPNVTFRVVLDGNFLNDMKSSIALTNLAEGVHRLLVRAIPAGGKPSEKFAAYTWTVDTLPPEITVTFPPERSLTDRGQVAISGTYFEEGTVPTIVVNGERAALDQANRTWRVLVPLLEKHTTLDVEIVDEVGRTAQDSSRRISHVLIKEAVAPAPPPEPEKPKAPEPNMSDYDIHIDEQTDEAVLIDSLTVTAISLSTGERRTVSSGSLGAGADFRDVVVMAPIPKSNDVVIFDRYMCRIFSVDLATGDRSVLWETLGPHDIPVNQDGLIASDGKTAYVQGPIDARLVALSLDGSNRRTLVVEGWVARPVAMVWDGARDRLLVTDATTGHIYEVDPETGDPTIMSEHHPDFRIGYQRGLVIDGDRALTLSRARNAVVEIDLKTGTRSLLRLSGDGLTWPRAIAHDKARNRLVVLDNRRRNLMYIDLDTGECREHKIEPEPSPEPSEKEEPKAQPGNVGDLEGKAECEGPIFYDPDTGDIRLLDGGRNALITINCRAGTQEVLANLGEDAPDAVDFHLNPTTGEPIVLERHGIYRYENDCQDCVAVETDEPLVQGAGLRVSPDGRSAILLDTYPEIIQPAEGLRYTVHKDRLIRLDLVTGQTTVLADSPAASMSSITSATGGVFLQPSGVDILLGTSECAADCIQATIRSVDLLTGKATTIYGLVDTTPTKWSFIGGSATPATEFSALVRDETRDEIFTLDRQQGVIGRIHNREPSPRYEVFSGERPYFSGKNGWRVIAEGHGPRITRARGIALDERAGMLFVTVDDRVIAVDLRTGDRVIAAVLE